MMQLGPYVENWAIDVNDRYRDISPVSEWKSFWGTATLV